MSSTQSLGSVAAGVITAVVEQASPGLVTKAQTVTTHDVGTFFSHNPGLVPVTEDLISFAEQQAQTHGLGMVTDFLSGLIGIFAQAPTATTVATPAAAPKAS